MDWNSDLGKRLAERLQKEQVIWLVTVTPDGIPQPTPVWFLWDGETFLVYTRAGSAKLRNIAHNSQSVVHLNCDEWGGSVAVFTGAMLVASEEPPALENPAYLDKYADGIKSIQMTPQSFSAEYCVALRMTPAKIRSW